MATLNIGGTYYKIVHSETLTPGSLEKSLDHHLNQLSKEKRLAFRRVMESHVQTQEHVSSAAEDEFEKLMAELHANDEAYMRLFKKFPEDPYYKTIGDLDAEILKLDATPLTSATLIAIACRPSCNRHSRTISWQGAQIIIAAAGRGIRRGMASTSLDFLTCLKS